MGPPATPSSAAAPVALPRLFHPFSSSSPSTSPSSSTSFGASAEASSFPPPHTSNLPSFSLSPSRGRHPLCQLRQEGRGRLRRRRRPPVARRPRRRYRPRAIARAARHPVAADRPVLRAAVQHAPRRAGSQHGPSGGPLHRRRGYVVAVAARCVAAQAAPSSRRAPVPVDILNIIMYRRGRACACLSVY